MASLNTIVATTELDAVNAALSAIGEAPITDVDSATQSDVALILRLLKAQMRAVLALQWKFNTDFAYQIAPTATLVWTDNDSVSTTLNVFLPPTDLLAFQVSKTEKSHGKHPDLVIRTSKYYGDPTFVPVFYDRELNREGLVAADFPYLYIDAVWSVDFTKMPETARQYIVIRAARQFIQQALGSSELAGFTQADELFALRALKRDQGAVDEYNVLSHPAFGGVLGGRRFRGSMISRLSSPNHS
ncbi:MAG TPA: hypothetical protein VM537_21695 [Anaerolineae bacterium]|nr:hypothetical protein [Anaerolineae bacterium]